MDTGDLSTILVLIALLACSAFFSASETAYTSLNTVRLKRMAGNGDKRAEKVLNLVDRYDVLLSSILVGNNIVNIMSASIATVLFVKWIGVQGAAIATAISSFVIYEVRKKYLSKGFWGKEYWMIVGSWLVLLLAAIAEVYLSKKKD